MSIDFSKQFGRGSAKSTWDTIDFMTYMETHEIKNPYKFILPQLKPYSVKFIRNGNNEPLIQNEKDLK